MRKIQLIIVENDYLVGQEIEHLAMEAGFLVRLNVQSEEDLWREIGQVEADLVLMDIDLNEDQDGIDLALEVNRQYQLPVVFISGMTDSKTIQRARSVFPGRFNFLTKPIKLSDLKNLVEHWMDHPNPQVPDATQRLKSNLLFIQEGTAQVPVNKSEIAIIESDGSYCAIKTGNKTFSVSSNLKKIHAALADDRFFRISRSHIVNLEKVLKLSTYTVQVKVGDGMETLEVGKTYHTAYKNLRSRLKPL